jgi:hypothetical protein
MTWRRSTSARGAAVYVYACAVSFSASEDQAEQASAGTILGALTDSAMVRDQKRSDRVKGEVLILAQNLELLFGVFVLFALDVRA